jgi:dynein heavy chain
MGRVHKMVGAMCDVYFAKMSRQVFVTPKSYLSFIASFKSVYATKLSELEEQEGRVKLGLEKLADAA